MSKEMVIAEAARVMLSIERNASMSLIIEPCPDPDREGWWQVRECPDISRTTIQIQTTPEKRAKSAAGYG